MGRIDTVDVVGAENSHWGKKNVGSGFTRQRSDSIQNIKHAPKKWNDTDGRSAAARVACAACNAKQCRINKTYRF